MNNRGVLLISLLILGLLLIGGGIWWKIDASSSNLTIQPIISMEVTDDNVGSHDFLYICEDKSVYYIQEIQARSDLGRGWSKTYRKGQLIGVAFDGLIQQFRDNLDNLQETYQFPGYIGADGILIKGSMDTVLIITYQSMAKKISATGYLGMYSSYLRPGSAYAGMPAPLDKICKQLWQIGAATEEFYKEATP